MQSLNRLQLIGNIGKDPVVRFTPTGTPIAFVSIATNDVYKDKQGQTQKRTDWHRAKLWGKLGEFAREYLKQGKQVYVEGPVRTEKFKDASGQDRYWTQVVVLRIMLLGKRDHDQAESTMMTLPEHQEGAAIEESPDGGGGDFDETAF